MVAWKLNLIREALLVEKSSGAQANGPSLIACVIGLSGEAHETKTEMAGDCSRHLAAGIRHSIILVATRPDHRRIVAEDPNWHDGARSGGDSRRTRHEPSGILCSISAIGERTWPVSLQIRRSNSVGAGGE